MYNNMHIVCACMCVRVCVCDLAMTSSNVTSQHRGGDVGFIIEGLDKSWLYTVKTEMGLADSTSSEFRRTYQADSDSWNFGLMISVPLLIVAVSHADMNERPLSYRSWMTVLNLASWGEYPNCG